MAKSIQLKNDTYLDSTSIIHNREKLSVILNNVLGKNIPLNTIVETGRYFDNKKEYLKVVTIPLKDNASSTKAMGLNNPKIHKVIATATNGTITIGTGFNDEWYINRDNIIWNTKTNRSNYTAYMFVYFT